MMNSVFFVLKKFTKSALTENLGLKAVAAFFAVLFYFLVMFQEEAERNFDVEIIWDLPEKDSGLVLSNELPDELRIRLRGPSSTIESIKPGSVRAKEIDLSQHREGTAHYYFSEEDFEIPTRTKFIRVTPESALVRMERLVTRRLPVRVRTYGKLEAGTEFVTNPTASPNSVTVVGPASTMRNLSAIDTEDVDIEGLTTGEHPFVVPARRIDGVAIHRGDEFRINLRVGWIPGKRLLPDVKPSARGTELPAKFKPGTVAVELSGPQAVLDKLDSINIVPIVVVPEEFRSRPGLFSGEITIEGLPNNVYATSVKPNEVQVRLTNPGTSSQKKKPKNQ